MKSKQFYFLMIGLIGLGLIGIVGAYYWGSGQLEAKALVISDLKTDRDIAREKIIFLNNAQKSVENAENATKLLDTLLPNKKQQEVLLADVIYTATSEAGVPIDNIKTISFTSNSEPNDTSGTIAYAEVPGVLSYPFTMTIDNISYETLIKLLQEIETNGRLVQVGDIQITLDKNNPGNIGSVSLSLKAFLKP